MPDAKQDRDTEAPPALRTAGRRTSPVVLVGAVVVLALGVVATVLLMQGSPRTSLTESDPGGPVNPSDWLDIPVLKIEEVPLSVPLAASGAQRKQLTVSVAIRFAPPEGVEPDIDGLKKEFIPRVTNLSPEFKHIIIEEISSKVYSELISTEVKNTMLKTFTNRFNDKLKSYGLYKEARVIEVMWGNFFWEE